MEDLLANIPFTIEHAALLGVLILGLTQSLKQANIPHFLLPFVAALLGGICNIWLTGSIEAYDILSGVGLGFVVSGVVNFKKEL